MSIGSELRQAREASGLSLRDISARTNIRQAVLKAIEADQFQGLPGGVVMRGFLKLYAREVGLDPDAIVRRYAQDMAVGALSPAAPAGAQTGESRITRAGVIGVGVALALLSIGYAALRPAAPDSGTPAARVEPPSTADPVPAVPGAPPQSPGAATPAGGVSAMPAPAPVGASAAAGPSVSPSAEDDREREGDALRIDLLATGECWLSATVDGRRVAYRTLNPGDRLDVRVVGEAVLRIGSPGHLTVSINGRPIRPFERPGSPATLRITPQTYRDLLAP